MLVKFEELPQNSRVWIYQSKDYLNETQVNNIQKLLEKFTTSWESHQKPLKASFEVAYNRFIILAVDESFNQASGCSIDSSVHFLKELENQFGLDLFNRQYVAFWQGEEVKTTSLLEIKQKIAEGIIQENTLIFNNLVSDIASFKQKWQQNAKETWVARYF